MSARKILATFVERVRSVAAVAHLCRSSRATVERQLAWSNLRALNEIRMSLYALAEDPDASTLYPLPPRQLRGYVHGAFLAHPAVERYAAAMVPWATDAVSAQAALMDLQGAYADAYGLPAVDPTWTAGTAFQSAEERSRLSHAGLEPP